MSTAKTPFKISQRVTANARRLRKMHGWSAEELARRLTASGCPTTRHVIANRENRRGTNRLTVDELFALADVFGRPMADLVLEDVQCERCAGSPPPGFICQMCGTTA